MNDDAILSLPLDATIFFPISGNPAGFNHIAAAEWLLRANPAWRRVVFVLNNGLHPDPTKPNAQVSAATRLDLLETAIAQAGIPELSHLERQAERAGDKMLAGPQSLQIWNWEFALDRAVRTVESVQALLEAHAGDSPSPDLHRINWFAGSDLIARMADPAIFAEEDLATLANQCHYAILEREGHPVEEALADLARARGVELDCEVLPLGALPAWLSPYLALSSTLIRRAAEIGDPLGAMVTAGAEERIREEGIYGQGPPVARLVDFTGAELASRSALQLELERLRDELESEGAALAARLAENHESGWPHTLAVAEATVGGLITMALAARSGASRYFHESRFAYDARAKRELTGELPAGVSAVSEELVTALARGMREKAGTDFALAESGMAGPADGRRRSFKNGTCQIAFVTPKDEHVDEIRLNPFLTRKEHQLRFAIHALGLARKWLAEDGY